MVTSFRASAWPGTEVIGSPGLVSVIRFNKSVKEILLKTQPDLQKWLAQYVECMQSKGLPTLWP